MIPDTAQSDRILKAPVTGFPWRRAAIIALIVLGLLSLLVWFVRAGTPSVDSERVRIAEIGRGELVRDAQVNGRTVAAISATLNAPAAGIIELKVKAGDAVKQGDLLARIESPALQNELARERATLLQLEADVARERIQAQKQALLARRTADEAALALTSANRDQQRLQRACEVGAIARVECMRAEDAVKAASIRNRHADADAALETQATRYELDSRLQQLARQRAITAELQRRVEELQLRAPIDGLVGNVAAIDRAKVAENTALITVVDLRQLEIELELPELYADDLGLGMPVEVSLGGVKADGAISSIAPEVINRQVLARVRLKSQPEGLRQNQRVSARVLIERKADVVKAPRGPYFEQYAGRVVYVVEGDVAHRRAVQLGASSVDAIEVIQGLKPGERIVVSGSEEFQDAEAVRLR